MAPIGYSLKNICDGRFIGWKHEGKIRYRIMLRGFPLHHQGKIYIQFSQAVFLSLEIYISIPLYLLRGGARHFVALN